MSSKAIRKKLDSWRSRYRESGFDALLYSLSWRLPKWLFSYTHSYLVVANDMTVTKPSTNEYDFRLAKVEDAEAFALLNVSASTVLHRLAEGDLCGVAVRNDGMVCSMVWAATGQLYLEGAGMLLDVDPEGVYVYNSYTLQELRGRSLYRGCSSVICDWFRERGRTIRYGIIELYNRESFEANAKINLKVAGEARLFELLGIRLTRGNNWPKSGRKLRIAFGKRTRNARTV